MKATGQITITSPVLEEVQLRDRDDLRGRGMPGVFNSTVIQRDLSRYYAMMRRTLATLELSQAEASLICDALNGTWLLDHGTMTSSSARQVLAMELSDSITMNSLDKKWEVAEGPFIAKVHGWSEAQCLAVLDAVERFWDDSYAATVESVGLVK